MKKQVEQEKSETGGMLYLATEYDMKIQSNLYRNIQHNTDKNLIIFNIQYIFKNDPKYNGD